MLKEISLGKYCDTGSILHKTDPRIKTIMYLVYLIVIFMVSSYPAVIAVVAVTLIQLTVAKIPLKVIKSSIMPIIPLAIFIFILNAISIKQGEALFNIYKFTITNQGLYKASIMSIRLIMLILSTSVLLTLTTTPLKTADALESLFSPLKKIKVPVHEMAMMMSIALRFIPTLGEETDKIMKAQVSRGADYDTGTVINRIRGYITVLVPLFVSSFKHAEELAVAMDARCYRGGEGRTKLNPLKITKKDIVVAVFLALGAALILAAEFIRL